MANPKNPFPDPVPILVVDGQEYRLAPPLSTFQMIWAAFPLILLFLGGAIGGALGAGAMTISTQIFRSKTPVALQWFLSAACSLAAFVLWLLFAVLVQRARTGT